ncbi:MAG: insulinase family protein [Holophagales bacterium]|nr:insulinase family protein [Holophagales bacterium]MYC10063.1 insulinase family protein [Holophagales bacterium]
MRPRPTSPAPAPSGCQRKHASLAGPFRSRGRLQLGARAMPTDREPSRLDLWSGRLRLAALRVPDSGVVAARVWLRGGSRVGPSPGLALLCGRMLVEGTARRTWREIAEQAEARGVSLNGFASAEVHGLSIDALADDAGLALEWLAELVLEPGFDRGRFKLLRDQTLGELRSLADRPEVVAGWTFRDQLYHPHPLASPSQGTSESLAALTPEDCLRFHGDALARGGVVAVAGDIDEDAVLADLARLFGGSAKGAIRTVEPPAPRGRSEKRIELVTGSRAQAHVYAGHFTVDRRHPDLPELRALGILLGSDGLAGRIPHRVREQEGLAYATHVDVLAGAGTDPGALSVYLGTHPDHVERGLELVREALHEVIERPPEAAVLEACKTGMYGREPFLTETAGLWAGLLVDALLFDLPSYRRSWRLERIERLSPDGVFQAAGRHLKLERLLVTVGVPGQDGCARNAAR